MLMTHLIKHDTADLAADVDARRADAENTSFLQAVLSVHSADSKGGRKCRWDDDGDDVERAEHNLVPHNLQQF